MSFQLIVAIYGGCNKTKTFTLPPSFQPASKKADKPVIRYTYHIISGTENTYGYNIFDGKHLLIHQPTIPGQPSNRGFKNKIDAQKVAAYVITKLNDNIMPPGVSDKELKQMNIKF
ncbi:MAG: hypothetical protein JWN56_257 [Sphingobacteriales bacterium]|nr:hypothetical protein [Sphingobacteriales bacterium]